MRTGRPASFGPISSMLSSVSASRASSLPATGLMNLATTFLQRVALLDDVLAGASEFERRRFYRDNAAQIYRLG